MPTREFVGKTFGQHWHYLQIEVDHLPTFWHYHPEFELTLTRHRTGNRYIGSDVGPFGPLDLALVAPNQAHAWAMESCPGAPPLHLQVVFLGREWLRSLALGPLPELTRLLGWLEGIQVGVVFSEACIQRVLPLFDRLEQAQDLVRLATLLEILDLLSRDEHSRSLGASGDGSTDPRLQAALAFLEAHFIEPITLGEIAGVAHVSEATLKRLFRGHLNLSMSELLMQMRLGRACELLISTESSIELIAEQSGFVTPSHFFRQFKRHRGCSPAHFRREYHLRRQDNGHRATSGFRTSEGRPKQHGAGSELWPRSS